MNKKELNLKQQVEKVETFATFRFIKFSFLSTLFHYKNQNANQGWYIIFLNATSQKKNDHLCPVNSQNEVSGYYWSFSPSDVMKTM